MDAQPFEVLLIHPHGELWLPLKDWIHEGPGPRQLLHPVAARMADTHERLPLRIIPFRYRNTRLSRILISVGLLRNPWIKRQ